MRTVLICLVVLESFVSSDALAESERRDPFSIEVALGGGWSASPSTHAGRMSDGGFASVRLGFFAPYEDGIQGGAGVLLGVDGEGNIRSSGLLGVRLLSGFDVWQTRIDVQALVDAWPELGVGVRLAFGGLVRLGRGFRLGAELGGAFVAGNVRGAGDASIVALYAW